MADIPINENDRAVIVVATTAGQTDFDFDFPAFDAGHVAAKFEDISAGTTTDLVANTDFTVTGLNDANGGTISLVSLGPSVAVGDKITIYGDIPIERTSDFQQSGDYFAETVNTEEDTQFMIMQELSRDAGRSLQLPIGESGDFELPSASERAGRYLGFDASGDIQMSEDLGFFATYPLRSDFISASITAPDGAVIAAGKRLYQASSGATDIADKPGFIPFGVITPNHFAMNSLPGVTDMTAAIQAAIDYAESLCDTGDTFNIGASGVTVDLGGQLMAISSGLTIARPIRFGNGSLVALSGFGSTFMLTTSLGAEGVVIDNISLDGGRSGTTRYADLIYWNTRRGRLSRARGVNFPNFGLRVVEGQEAHFMASVFREWKYADSGTTDATQRTATGISVETADAHFTDVIVAQSLIPWKVTGALNSFTACHVYNGGDTGAGEVAGFVVDDSAGTARNNRFIAPYIDNCTFKFITGGTSASILVLGPHFQKTGNGSNTKGFIFETGTANTDLAGAQIIAPRVNGSITSPLSFDTTGVGSYVDDAFLKLAWLGPVNTDGTTPWNEFNMGGFMHGDSDDLFVTSGGDTFNIKANKGLVLEADHDNNSGSGDQSTIFFKTDGVVRGTANSDAFEFDVNAIFNNRVGVGTLNPDEELHVVGGAVFGATSGGASNGNFRFNDSDTFPSLRGFSGGSWNNTELLNGISSGSWTSTHDDTTGYFSWRNYDGSSTYTNLMRLTNDGHLGIGTTSPTSKLDVADSTLRLRASKTPASATDTGNKGEFCYDDNYFYVCVQDNQWRRAALAGSW